MIRFTIPIAPITKKNHQQVIFNHKTQKPMVIQSKQYREYEKACGYFIKAKGLKINESVNVKATYYMPTRRIVDLVNLHQALLDILVKYEVIGDDNSRIVVSLDGSRVLYDKDNPRTEVEIERR